MKKKGILLIALGHPYYGRYAANLALSIKSTSNVSISLVHDTVSLSHLSEGEKNLFDKKIPCKNKWNMVSGIDQHIMAKLYLNEMTPYDETLYLDVDMIWHPKRSVEDCIGELSKLNFTMQNRGTTDLKQKNIPSNTSFWCDLNQMKEVYGVKTGKWWNLSSEFVWFKKTPDVIEMFEDAQKHYRTIKMSHTQFGSGIPDELCFALSMLRHTKITPHKEGFRPIFWDQEEPNALGIPPSTMYAKWYGYSMGGATCSADAKRYYNNLVKYYAQLKGIQHPFKAKDKREFVYGRNHI